MDTLSSLIESFQSLSIDNPGCDDSRSMGLNEPKSQWSVEPSPSVIHKARFIKRTLKDFRKPKRNPNSEKTNEENLLNDEETLFSTNGKRKGCCQRVTLLMILFVALIWLIALLLMPVLFPYVVIHGPRFVSKLFEIGS